MRSALLLFLAAGVVAAQSVPPRKDIPALAKAANGAIVSIIMSDNDGHAIAQGTGFVISKDGRIVTNYHVIENGSSAIVKLPDGAFFVVDGVLSFDKARDVAVIKAHGENFRALALGNSDQVQVGEEVVAIGNPLSLESTVSNGIVSGIRTAEELGGKFLQVTTPISPGSSGGPLFNMAGEVIGITTLYLEGGENLNFAIPINDAKRLLLTESTQIQAFPNEPEPVQGGTHAGDAPSPVASPPVQPPMEHAATAEQCEADARVWGAPVRTPLFSEVVKTLSYSEIYARVVEMSGCAQGPVDESIVRKTIVYVAVQNTFQTVEIDRLDSYIARHDLWNQYMSEQVPYLAVTQDLPKHAPTQKQCDADMRLWSRQLQAGMADQLSVNDLYVRTREMQTCSEQPHKTNLETVATDCAYWTLAGAYDSLAAYRTRAYLLRHNEWSQFVSEDAAGVR